MKQFKWLYSAAPRGGWQVKDSHLSSQSTGQPTGVKSLYRNEVVLTVLNKLPSTSPAE